MKIRMISKNDSALAAWNSSRPEANEKDSSKIYNLDLPVSEFVRFDIEITSSIFTRELFCSLRDHVIWAQTSRVQNVLEFNMVEELSDDESFSEIRRMMIKKSLNGDRQDEYRLTLPMFSKTTYAISISLRHLVNVSKNLKYISGKCKDPYVSRILLVESLSIDFITNGYDTSSHKMKPILNEDIISDSNLENGEFLTVTSEIPLYLRAQLVRHRQLLLVDNLIDIVALPDSRYLTIEDLCKIQVVGSKSFLQEVASKRRCWISQYGIWSEFL